MVWKKTKLFDSFGKIAYLDEYGLCYFSLNSVFLKTKNRLFRIEDVYLKTDSNAIKFCDKHNRSEFLKLFDYDEVCFWDEVEEGAGYWSHRKVIYPSIGKYSILIRLDIYSYSAIDRKFLSCGSEDLKISSKEGIEKYNKEILTCNDHIAVENLLKIPMLSRIDVGQHFYLPGKGTVTVSEVFEYPNKSNKICKIVGKDGYSTSVTDSDLYSSNKSFFELPFDKVINESELKQFNDNLNEASLAPFVLRAIGLINIYWDLIEDASNYVVELYKYQPNEIKFKKVYHLKDYDVDRNTRFLAINNLVGDYYIIVVKAENRNGELIAKSRGILRDKPQWFLD